MAKLLWRAFIHCCIVQRFDTPAGGGGVYTGAWRAATYLYWSHRVHKVGTAAAAVHITSSVNRASSIITAHGVLWGCRGFCNGSAGSFSAAALRDWLVSFSRLLEGKRSKHVLSAKVTLMWDVNNLCGEIARIWHNCSEFRMPVCVSACVLV